MDPVDSQDLSMEFVALYTRHTGEEIQVRLDLLDLDPETQFDLSLAFRTGQSGKSIDDNSTWDILISSNSAGNLQVSTSRPNLKVGRLRILRDPVEDAIVISFSTDPSSTVIGNSTFVTAWITAPGSVKSADSIGPVKFSAPPPKQAIVVLYFWNTFAAATPAQALRRWDGAHTGPDSARHGLKHLLDAVEDTKIPVVLSDLNTPENLSALDYMATLDKVRQMANAGFISMPNVSSINLSEQPVLSIPGWVFERELSWAGQVSREFFMPETQALVIHQWSDTAQFPGRYRLVLPSRVVPFSTASLCYQGQIRALCNLAYPDDLGEQDPDSQVNENGFTTVSKKRLLAAALSGNETIFFLGGDLGNSSWGTQAAPLQALGYIRSHPWMRVLSLDELLSWKIDRQPGLVELPGLPGTAVPFVPLTDTGEPVLSGLTTNEINSQVLSRLEKLPDNELSDAIWEWYFGLLSADNVAHHRLNAATLGQIGHLLAGAEWAVKPYGRSACNMDLDWDGENECILSSDTFFGSFELQGGSLVIGLLRTPAGVHQVIAPTYQIYSGISDSFMWKTDQGYTGDPGADAGAFVDRGTRVECCLVSVFGVNEIEFMYLDMAMRKIYILNDTSLEVNYQTSSTNIIAGLLVNNPWDRFYSHWAVHYPAVTTMPNLAGFQLGPVTLSSNAELNTSLFTTSKEYLDAPEDPNFDYSAGHNLIFPFASFTVSGSGEFWIRLDWSNDFAGNKP